MTGYVAITDSSNHDEPTESMPRENILFGLDLDQREYDDALHRSARVPIFFSREKFPRVRCRRRHADGLRRAMTGSEGATISKSLGRGVTSYPPASTTRPLGDRRRHAPGCRRKKVCTRPIEPDLAVLDDEHTRDLRLVEVLQLVCR